MTIEKAQKDFDALIAKNGFTYTATTDLGHRIYHREWHRKVQVAWYGEQDPKFMRDYSSPKRAMNAIREIVRCAGFEW